MGRFVDLTGQHFGRLTVIERAGSYRPHGKYGNHSEPLWRCLCDPERGGCGKETFVIAHNLKNGSTKSCGCLGAELAAERLGTYRKCKKKS
jgi:hypothetical protein